MNQVIEMLCQHRSIREFTQDKITAAQLDSIISAGSAAASSSFLQTTSVIRVTDKQKRAQLAKLAGEQAYVESAAEFLVFCIDYQRHAQISNQVQVEYTELALIGAIDTGIFAQNMMVAAESLGLGGVYIGGLRNNIEAVDELLELPKYTAVLFGMCLGVPAQNPKLKPRLPKSIVLHENSYQSLDRKELDAYDEKTIHYYENRGSNVKSKPWSAQSVARLENESRPFMKDYFHKKGLATK